MILEVFEQGSLRNEPHHEKNCLCHMQTTKAQISLRIWDAQSDQHFCCSLPRYYNISSFYIGNFMPLASFFGCTGQFVSYLVENPENRFSRDVAQMYLKIVMRKPAFEGV